MRAPQRSATTAEGVAASHPSTNAGQGHACVGRCKPAHRRACDRDLRRLTEGGTFSENQHITTNPHPATTPPQPSPPHPHPPPTPPQTSTLTPAPTQHHPHRAPTHTHPRPRSRPTAPTLTQLVLSRLFPHSFPCPPAPPPPPRPPIPPSCHHPAILPRPPSPPPHALAHAQGNAGFHSLTVVQELHSFHAG